MRISPALMASITDSLAPRVRRRVDALLADPVPIGPEIGFGNATVRLADVEVATSQEHITCDCLLSPGCAHRAAVALSLDVTDDETPTAPEAPPIDPRNPAERLRRLTEEAARADARTITREQSATADLAWEHLTEVLLKGAGRLGAAQRAGLAADLHRMRIHGLVVADRALTGFVHSIGRAPAPRMEAFSAALLNLHRLRGLTEGQDANELLGRPRQPYQDIGGLTLTPLFAEPVITASGFAGTQITFQDQWKNTWSLARLRPGTARDVPARYEAGETWGGISESPLTLSRHRVLVADATARRDGRLGGGGQVRAALQAPWKAWENVPEGFEVVSGEIEAGDRHGLLVTGRHLELLPAARTLGAGLATELFGATGATVTCLVRGNQLLGLNASADGPIRIPEPLGGLWWPGLDVVTRSWVGNLPAFPDDPDPVDVAEWNVESPRVTETTKRWCERVLDAGPGSLSSPLLAKDAAWLEAAGAPFASSLLTDLAEATRRGQRRFDGTWEQDPEALARAWLRLSTY